MPTMINNTNADDWIQELFPIEDHTIPTRALRACRLCGREVHPIEDRDQGVWILQCCHLPYAHRRLQRAADDWNDANPQERNSPCASTEEAA